jgi:hypothetical protein
VPNKKWICVVGKSILISSAHEITSLALLLLSSAKHAAMALYNRLVAQDP